MLTETNAAAAIVPTASDASPVIPAVAPAFSANLNTDAARKAAAKLSLAAKTAGKRAITTKRANKPVVKPTAKRVVTVKPAKPSKPAANDRSAVISANRARVGAIYNGPSPVVRGTSKLVSLTAYDQRHANPVQRTSLDKLTVRDESNLALMLSLRTAGFDPAAHNIDLGGFSRLCSVGAIKRGDKAGTFQLTPSGASLARKAVAARKAA